MLSKISISADDLNRVKKSNKDFMIFRVNEHNELTGYKLTNDARRNRIKYPHLIDIKANKSELKRIELTLKIQNK